MSVKLQDRNLIVNYIQDYLRDYFGMTLVRVTQKSRKALEDVYEISQSRPIKVSGVYTEDTYISVGLFMAYNYPNEQFPVRWDLKEGSNNIWIKTPFCYDKLIKTMTDLLNDNKVLAEIESHRKFTQDHYREFLESREDPSEYISDYEELSRYFDDNDVYNAIVSKSISDLPKEFTREDANKSLIVFLVHNLEESQNNRDILSLDDRVLSYFFEEVVTPLSEPDEILRAQKLIYIPDIEYDRAGKYDSKMIDDVKKRQQNFLSVHTSESTGEVVLPEGFEGFKVTGYVDPWTEVVLKGGID